MTKGESMVEYFSFKRLLLDLLILGSACLIGCGTGGAYHESNGSIASADRYLDYRCDDLDSYGEWMTLPPYSQVWKPNVTQDWRPFHYGHWDYTDPNWTWVSYEPYGWIVYHYGNWLHSGTYGWVWIPGNGAWSPAMVEWMSYEDLVCWAPRPPRDVILPRPWERDQQGIDIWDVVHARDFAGDNVGQYRLESSVVRPRDQHVQIINRFPDLKMIEKYTGRPVPNVKIPREPVKVGKQQLHKMQVPPADQQRSDQHQTEVEKNVTRRSGNHR
jgi:hypothetical protein